jgi:hypothetical protein
VTGMKAATGTLDTEFIIIDLSITA